MAATLPATPYNPANERTEPGGRPPGPRRHSAWPDVVFSLLAHSAAWLTLALLAGIIGVMGCSSWGIVADLDHRGWLDCGPSVWPAKRPLAPPAWHHTNSALGRA